MEALYGGAGVDGLTGGRGGAGNDQSTLANRGGLNADSITDFKAYIVRSKPGSSAGAVIEDDALILANRLDEGLVGASAAGIKGLTFSGGNGVGNTLASSSFFNGAGMKGASFGAAAGIFVNTSSGDVFYNDAKEAGSYLIARLGSAGVTGITVHLPLQGGWHRPSWRAQDPAVSPDSRLKRIGAVRIRFAPARDRPRSAAAPPLGRTLPRKWRERDYLGTGACGSSPARRPRFLTRQPRRLHGAAATIRMGRSKRMEQRVGP